MEYPEAPTYIVHKDLDGDTPAGQFMDTAGNVYNIVTTENGMLIDGVDYYNKDKVDELISQLTTQATEAINQAVSEVKEWATGQFEAKE